jgi:hypothetical protein
MNIFKTLLYIFVIIQLVSCSEELQSKLKSTPNALGTANQIVVIADDALWESELGDTFRFYYEAAYPMLPAPEPMYDLKHYTPQDLINGPLRKELRTYLYLADLSDNGSQTAKEIAKDIGEEKYMKIKQEGSSNNVVARDKWAVGQIMVYLAGKDKEDLINNIINSFSSVSKRIYDQDYKQIRGYTFSSGYNKALIAEVEEKIGVRMNIPAEYIKAKYDEEEQMMWLRKETSMASFSIVMKSIPYSSENQLTKEYLKNLINDFGKEHLTTNTPGSIMVVNDEDLPLYTHTREVNGQYTFEMRGIWEATKDYIGGPFFAYLILDKSQKKLLFIYDFLLAPGEQKRDLMQQLELLTNTMEII